MAFDSHNRTALHDMRSWNSRYERVPINRGTGVQWRRFTKSREQWKWFRVLNLLQSSHYPFSHFFKTSCNPSSAPPKTSLLLCARVTPLLLPWLPLSIALSSSDAATTAFVFSLTSAFWLVWLNKWHTLSSNCSPLLLQTCGRWPQHALASPCYARDISMRRNDTD